MSMEQPQNREKKLPTIDLEDVAKQLYDEAFENGPGSIVKSPRMYNLARTISPRALESLGELSFETTIMEIDDKLVLATGNKGSTVPTYFSHVMNMENGMATLKETVEQTMNQMLSSRFKLHNHPGTTLEGIMGLDLAISDGDIRFDDKSKGEILFVLTNKGIVGYKPRNSLPDMGILNIVMPSQTAVRAYDGPNRVLQKQRDAGITEFFVPFRGDEESQRKLELICQYINDPSVKWGSIRSEIEK